MKLPFFQVDAFADRVFAGNPAAVVPLEVPLGEELMQRIAAENNLSETAFPLQDGDRWSIRWFTPAVEVALCGHATLASAFVLRHAGLVPAPLTEVTFESASGPLMARYDADRIVLDFPADPPRPAERATDLANALGKEPLEVHAGGYLLALFEDERAVRALTPDMAGLQRIGRPVIVTARGDEVDFVSRFFGPGVGVPEDPVTGSAHCILTPFWAQRIGRKKLVAHQVSARGGRVDCELAGDRVHLGGDATLYAEGTIRIPG